MRAKDHRHFLLITCIIVCMSSSLSIANDANSSGCASFQKALTTSNNNEALSIGNSIFSQLEGKYRSDRGFGGVKSKMVAADLLASKMISQLKEATTREMSLMGEELFGKKGTKKKGHNREKKNNLLLILPAKNFYETSERIFKNPIKIDALSDEEKGFLVKYCNLKLRCLLSTIAEAGQALSAAAPTFNGTHDYVMVLPLLNASEENPVNIEVFPNWMQEFEQLDKLSDSCLFHFGLPYQAMMIKKQAAEKVQQPFSELNYYKEVISRLNKKYAHVATECLERAIGYIPKENIDEIVSLRFEIVQRWMDSDNYSLAAGQARKIYETYSTHSEAGKAIWLYYYAVSRNNNTEQILAGIDNALADERCKDYNLKLMYMKWWALRQMPNQINRAIMLGYELIQKYGENPIIAPVLLSRSTDLLSQQDYNSAYELLQQLVDKFPNTTAAQQARPMMVKLKSIKGI